MDAPQPPPLPRPVLTYATPMSRRHVRKPLRTRIIADPHRPCVHFIEVSAEEKGAIIGAMVFVLIMLVVMGAMAVSEWQRLLERGMRAGRPGQFAFLVFFCLAQLGATLYVIQVVWKRTILSARDGELWLEVSAPIGSSVRRWESEQIDAVEAWTTDEGSRALEALAELHIRPRGGSTLTLLRNYPRSQIVPIAWALEHALRAAPAPTVTPPAPGVPPEPPGRI